MKTAERILVFSLALFNHHGEANVSSVDIANELDISPGNLYYHFKGKDVIIAALFERYQSKLLQLLKSPPEAELSVNEFFYYLLMVLEHSHEFRFLFRNPAELGEKYPSITKGFQKSLIQVEKTIKAHLDEYRKQGILLTDSRQLAHLVELIGIVSSQMANYQLLKSADINDGRYIYQAVATVLFAMAPYINIEKQDFNELAESVLSLSRSD